MLRKIVVVAGVLCLSVFPSFLFAVDVSISVRELEAQSFFSSLSTKLGYTIELAPDIDLLITYNTHGQEVPAEKIFWSVCAFYGIRAEDKGNNHYLLTLHPNWLQSPEARRVEINPDIISPSDKNAVGNGYVMLFGKKINPPYKIERKGDKVFLQGIQIEPLTGPTEDKPLPEKSRKRVELFDRLWQIVDQNPQNIHDKLLAEAQSSPLISSAKWQDEYRLILTFTEGDQMEFNLEDKGERISSTNIELEPEEEFDLAKIIKETLNNGGGIAIGYDYTIFLTSEEVDNIANKLDQIIPCNENSTRCFSRLQGLLNSYYWALDVMYNYEK